jgi:2-aminoadipate transaminase
MPQGLDAQELLKEALAYKVAFVPGVDFHVGNTGRNTFRLNFSHESPPVIEEGIRRLGNLLKNAVRAGITKASQVKFVSPPGNGCV